MKQIIQDLNKGKTSIEDIPAPKIKRGHLIVRTNCSLISRGTEKMLIDFGKANLVQKAIQQPQKVKQVIDKIKSDGIKNTFDVVSAKLTNSIPLGYSNVGIVIESDVEDFSIGDRVVSNGPHAEIIRVPKNLAIKIPDSVSDQEASFTIVGSISLQGVRLSEPTFGETFVVFGLGLIGLITIQLLKANGINVIGIDIDKNKCKMAKAFGVEAILSNEVDIIDSVLQRTGNHGADAVIITASTTSNEIISQSAKMSRKRGRIVLVGVTGLDINRDDFYKKELTFKVSCSYGPGRYDSDYEIIGNDYPLPFVRWTEKRNFKAVLNAICKGQLKVKPLITRVEDLSDFQNIYNDKKSIASIFTYPNNEIINFKKTIQINIPNKNPKKCNLAILGSGNFSKTQILPAVKRNNLIPKYILSENGISSDQLAKKYKIIYNTTDINDIINDDDIDTLIISTRHDSHSKYVIEALEKGKNVFVEKPLAINKKQLDAIIFTYNESSKSSLMVGFNRRFSKHLQMIKDQIDNNNKINISITMNAGKIPLDHWVHNPQVGGGRVIGESCHLIDVSVFLTGSLVKSVCMNGIDDKPSIQNDNVSILIKHENGSNTSINYFSNGSKKYPKERVEVFSNNKVWLLDDYKTTTLYNSNSKKIILRKNDKGWENQFKKYFHNIKKGGRELIPFHEIINVTQTTFSAIESYKTNKWVNINY